ncbi:MAG: NAD(P)H-dependent oxidoreductase [Candidatus Polarisedimenticolaceae bacterium]|nr:NAD(P)H-dependent oxidoreductase [Candidatus Polarisedimenticolaceae bacterium]
METALTNSGKILILFAHPYPQQSRINRPLLHAVKNIPGVKVVDLYEKYPDFHINVRLEQQLLLSASLIIFHHPFYWYSAPAILKQWQDCVLEERFALHEGGFALRGKKLMSAVTVGHSRASYQLGGYDRFPIEHFLRPYEQMAIHCGMQYLAPFVVYSAHRITEAEIENQASQYRQLLLNYLAETDHE